jgi:uncharacterized protein (TIGR00255 family)
MIKSMTGYGLAQNENDKVSISVEIKSLNSKLLDASLRLPRNYNEKDFEIRNLISKHLERGKVTVSIDVQKKGEIKAKVQVNKALLKAYYDDLTESAQYIGSAPNDLFKVALNMPDVISTPEKDLEDETEWLLLNKTIEEALISCNQFREDEGNVLGVKLKEYIDNIRNGLNGVITNEPLRIQAIRERLRKQVSELLSKEDYDKNRFEQELIYYIEKLDVKEEIVRLENHLNYFIETMNLSEGTGKKMGFIAQEIGREINTIGSKANDAAIQRIVINMKEELEKIKEQSLNVL